MHTIRLMAQGRDQSEIVRGTRVILRSKNMGDAENDYIWATDPELMLLDACQPYPFKYSDYMAGYPEGLADSRKIQYAIETMEGEHIGNCTCYNIDHVRKEAEMGVLIGDQKYWGKGYGSDAVKTLMKHVFIGIGMQRIVLHTLQWNIRARECFRQCGFEECGGIVKQGYEFIKMEAYTTNPE